MDRMAAIGVIDHEMPINAPSSSGVLAGNPLMNMVAHPSAGGL